jgi:hypothetical protein
MMFTAKFVNTQQRNRSYRRRRAGLPLQLPRRREGHSLQRCRAARRASKYLRLLYFTRGKRDCGRESAHYAERADARVKLSRSWFSGASNAGVSSGSLKTQSERAAELQERVRTKTAITHTMNSAGALTPWQQLRFALIDIDILEPGCNQREKRIGNDSRSREVQ